MSAVPFLDVAAAYAELRSEIDAAVSRVLASGWYIGGPEVAAFEAEFAAYCEAGHGVGVGNGLDALHLTLRALGIGPGDEVIVASNGFIATLLAVSMTGATPVLVEPDPRPTISTRQRSKRRSRRGRGVAADPFVRPAGGPRSAARNRPAGTGCEMVEDAAQAQGARYKGRRIGGPFGRRMLELLPVQEPRRDGRRRRGHDQ